MKKLSHKHVVTYHCPFCNKDIDSSKKTDIYYRSSWIKGCYECFGLSIGELTSQQFQAKRP